MYLAIAVMGLGGLVMAAGMVAAVVLAPPGDTVNFTYVIVAVAGGTVLDVIGFLLLMRAAKRKQQPDRQEPERW
jgi:hypothetical protein